MRRETSEFDFWVLPTEQDIEFLTRLRAQQQLDLTPDEFTEVAKRAKGLYDAVPADALKEPAECSRRTKVIRALTIQMVILETLSGSGYRDLEWIRDALLEIKTGLKELEKGFTPELLQARKRPPQAGRESHHQRVVKLTSAMAYSALRRLDIDETKAARMVADCINKRCFLPARHPNQKSVSYRTIINWAKRNIGDDLVCIHFTRYGPQTSPKQIIADLEKFLEFHRAYGFTVKTSSRPHLHRN
jgi:hypothetical protein